MDLLDEYSAGLPQDKKDQLLKDNFMKLNQYCQFTGLELLTSPSARSTQALTGTYANYNALNAKITSSGGLVALIGSVTYTGVVAPNAWAAIVVDGITKREVNSFNSGVNGTIIQPLFWVGILPAGQHTIAIQSKVTGGSANIGATDSDSGYYVLEYRKG